MGISRICQCEYIGKYMYFEKLLVESDIEHLDENKSEIFLGSFARWGALFPGATFFCHEKCETVAKIAPVVRPILFCTLLLFSLYKISFFAAAALPSIFIKYCIR